MQQPFGYTLKFRLSPAQHWLNLGPGWAAIAGLLATGYPNISLAALLQLAGLWLLVDPILGTLWELSVNQKLWQRATRAHLPPPTPHGFFLPYAQPGSVAGHGVLLVRRYRLWWAKQFWPQFGGQVATFGVGVALALLLGLALKPVIFGLVVLAVSLILLTGLTQADLPATAGGRLQSIVQFLLPWLMAALLGGGVTLASLGLGIAFWAVYLGGIRMLGKHHRAEWLFFGGQITAILLLLGLRLLPGAAILAVLLAAEGLIRIDIDSQESLLKKSQPYLVIGLLVAGISLGVR